MIYFSIHLPSDSIPEAGQKICLKHLRDLSKTKKIHLISFYNDIEENYIDNELYSFCESVNLIKISNSSRLINLIRNPLLPLPVSVRSDSKITKLISEILEHDEDKEIYIEYAQGAYILSKLRIKTKSTVVFHDVISQSINRKLTSARKLSILRAFYWIQIKLTLAWEKKISKLINKSIVLNEKDKALLQDIGFNSDSVIVDYPTVSKKFYSASRLQYDPYNLLFWGAMNRPENEEAVLWFAQDILPKIKSRIPDIKFTVLGANPSPKVLKLQSSSILVTGFVDDPIPYFENAALAVAPLRQGAGVKLKVLEAIAAKLPVIGTSVAAEGVIAQSDELLVADSEDSFADTVIIKIQEGLQKQKRLAQESLAKT